MVSKDFPERRSLSQQRDLACRKGKDPVAKMHDPFGWFSFGCREVELHRCWIAMDEVIDFVSARIHSCDER